MNVKILSTLTFCLAAHLSYSQINWGINGGFNINDIVFKNGPILYEDNSSSNIGFHIGGFSEIKLTKKLLITPLLQISKKGFNSSDITDDVGAYYLEIPLLISYNLFNPLHIKLGPNISYNLSNEPFIQDDLDFGLVTGLKINITKSLFLYGRYYYGISKLNEIYEVDKNFNQNITTSHHRNIYFGIGYMISE